MKQAYQELLDNKQLEFDPAQTQAVDALVVLSERLVEQQQLSKTLKTSIPGLYFHGRVGRGKTMLMDLFFQQLAIENKKRIHFHHFMESVHQQLAQLTGKSEPLRHIAKAWAQNIDLLCFDEFYVTDIGDAMLLSGLFSTLFSQGITLVATSNCEPEQLYRNGLQRERFLPTIALINQYCQVISINGDVDHRRSKLAKNANHNNYFLLANQGNKELIARFKSQTKQESLAAGNIEINHRTMNYLAKSDNVIFFDFFALCSGPRSQRDYMALAKEYTAVFIANVPKFSGELIPAVFSGVEDSYQRSGVLMGDLQQLDDEARRFIALVDEFYDQGIKLIVSAQVDIFELYQGQQLAFEFERCQSRLIEMQNA
ncbi:cell division protein ZapE [Colwellia psychrerythraea]|uniref:AFG1-family ATPase n=1 Tax=Colwellia psychrerythraea TaxID=28229 RepID=A0A099L3P9_COLPS|nr:cell division protein ZapE [Colwellia psychrerythraea]KGJ97060.1 AFG1-family ATPase [Colwellia psychrerythraea]